MTASSAALGPIMADVLGLQLTASEKVQLSHPDIGGVILFRRNYQSIPQLTALIAEIKSIKSPELIIAVDHEGGRVQRFIENFTRIPAMRTLGVIYEQQGSETALHQSECCGWVLATELRALDVDFSFAPVLDLDWQKSLVIGNRSFHSQPEVVIALAQAFIKGLARGGMVGCGKHFPGHGYVETDSHCELPVDERDFDSIQQHDLKVFSELINQGLPAIMSAHVLYDKIDPEMPAGYSRKWLTEILRQQLNFKGLVFSDSLTMEGACGVGDIKERIRLSKKAGCDIYLICNRPDLVDNVLVATSSMGFQDYTLEWEKVRGLNTAKYYQQIMATSEFNQAQQLVASLYSDNDIVNRVEVGEAI